MAIVFDLRLGKIINMIEKKKKKDRRNIFQLQSNLIFPQESWSLRRCRIARTTDSGKTVRSITGGDWIKTTPTIIKVKTWEF